MTGSDLGFLGRGWAFPLETDADGAIVAASDEELVRRSIWLILSTSPGEREMRPDFGCAIHELVFAARDATTAGTVANAVRSALLRWEPRIDVLDVTVAPDPASRTLLSVDVTYRVRSTNNVFNLVYPFYLEGVAP